MRMLYRKGRQRIALFKKIRLFLCNELGWHVYHSFDGFDGCSATATCEICGFHGLIDSQGCLF